MAEAFFNKYSKQNHAESAALIKPQDKMHALVVRAMEERGINISNNKSKMISKDMVNEADLIVLMSKNLADYAKLISKRIEIWDIPDVIAKETDEHLYLEFIKTREIIEGKVRELINILEDT